jgi:hypothetical protein
MVDSVRALCRRGGNCDNRLSRVLERGFSNRSDIAEIIAVIQLGSFCHFADSAVAAARARSRALISPGK